MAYPAYRSHTTVATSVSGSGFVFTKPTGLAVGDYMLVACRIFDGTNNTISAPGGWTSLFNNGNSTTAYNFFEKTADSSDVAASNFTFTTSSACDHRVGYMAAFSGATSRQDYDLISLASGAVSGTVSVTPLTNESLAISTLVTYDNALSATLTSSARTITPSATLTEHVDTGTLVSTDGVSVFLASGQNTGTSEITAFSFTVSESVTQTNAGGVIILNGTQNASADVSHLNVSPTLFAPTASPVNVNPSVGFLTVEPNFNGVETAVSSDGTRWTPISKS